MGIGINNSDSAVSTAINVGAKAGLAAGIIEAGKAITPYAKNSYHNALLKQSELIDKFQKSGRTVAEYMQTGERAIKTAASPGSTHKTIQNWVKKGLSNEEIAAKLKNMNDSAVEINKMGTDKALKKLQESKKLFETGETSKFDAAKDAAKDVLGKVKNKVTTLKDGAVNAFKTTEGGIFDKIKAVKANLGEFINNNPAIKKGGKTALIAGIALGTLALITKAVKNHKANKAE